MEVTPVSLHSVRETANLLRVSIPTVNAMIDAGQLSTRLPAGSTHPRVTGASILAFVNDDAHEYESSGIDFDALISRKRQHSEGILAPLFGKILS